MALSAPVLAAGKLLLIFVVLILLLRRRSPLWLTILAGSLTAALVSGIGPERWPGIVFGVLSQPGFLILCAMIFLILVLSGVQAATGQSHKLVEGLEAYIKSPRIRLVLFPALVGLLPMPGGALFSCPMIRDAARNMRLGNERKALINYWFRHIWELAWPLYPGYALLCSMLDIPISRLLQFTFPAVFISFAAGWFFFLRDLGPALVQSPESGEADGENQEKEPLGSVLLHGLPIVVTLAGAALLGLVFSRLLPQLPGQIVFCVSLVLAILTALYQGRGERRSSLRGIAFNRNTGRIMLLLLAIYVFKDTIAEGGIVAELSHVGESPLILCLMFVVIPFISGILTGILVGLVGLAFPILLGVISHSPLQEYATPLIVLGLIAGNCGQMFSPLHVCLVVTGEFFSTTLPALLRSLARPTLAIFFGGALWALVLLALGVKL